MKCFSLNMGPDHEFEGLSLPFHEPPTSQHPSLCVSGMDMKEVDPPLSYPGGGFTEERCLGQKRENVAWKSIPKIVLNVTDYIQ